MIDLPEGLQGNSDTFTITADDGSTVGDCTVTADGTAVTGEELPVGAELSFIEGEAPSVEGAQWSGVSFEPSTLVVGGDDDSSAPSSGSSSSSGSGQSTPSSGPGVSGRTGGEAASTLPLMIGIGLLLMGAVVIGGAGIIWQHQAPTADAPVDLEGNAVSLAPEDTPSEEVVAQMDVEPGAEDEDGLVVPSVDHAVPLGTLSAVDGEITPPGFTEAYRVRNLGVPVEEAEDGTVYVVTHSVQDGYGPGSTGRSRRTARNVQPMQKIDISAKIPMIVKSCEVEMCGVGAASMAAP